MNEKRKGPPRRRLADRRTLGERRMELRREFDREARREDRRRGFERLLDREGRPRRKYRRQSYTVGEFGPRPVDVHVGGRVKARRTLIGMSRLELGKHLGLSFKQIEKYEKGMNRMGASTLWQFSLILGQPISYFFEGIGERKRKVDDLLAKTETLKFVRYLSACDPDVQKHLAAMINAVAGKAK